MPAPAYLNALRAFEATARKGSFAAAAEELNVTPAAVGQQVRGLEAWLGVTLFMRAGNGASRLELTDAARRALPAIKGGFEQLSEGVAQLRDPLAHHTLRVTVSPAFAAKWLLPRLERFQRAHPNLDVLIDTSSRSIDFRVEQVDIGVRYGLGRWAGLEATYMMGETLFPVCAPDYPMLEEGSLSLEALENCTLIHDVSMAGDDLFPTWELWLERAGVNAPNAVYGLKINNSAAVLQAAMERQGVALARSVMVRDDLKAGRLVRPFEQQISEHTLPQAYYIVHRPQDSESTTICAFRDWLLSEVNSSCSEA